jgi:pilus assembly protein CpaF
LKQPKVETTAQGTDRDGGARKTPADRAYHDLKARVHARLFEYLDVSKLARVSESRAWEDIAAVTRRVLAEENAPLTHEEREMFVKEIHHEVFGLGPLEPLLQDPTVCDVLVNGPHDVWVERRGKLERTSCRFKDAAHLMRIIERITASVGRRVDESTPMVDARLADGSRVNVIIPPLALDGPTLSIRRFAVDPLTCKDLIECGTLTRGIAALLEAAVSGRLNVLISGGTGVGKTTMLNVLSEFIPDSERIITIEDSAELQLRQEHVVRLETRPASIEGSGRVTQRELLINSLRMRPDRIIVGEVRGSEALDMLQAMNTGHNGSLTTIHANSPRDALSRLETMVAMAGLELSQRAVRQYIASAIEVVIQLVRLPDGSRRLASLQEITGLEGEVVTMQEICKLERRTDEQGKTVAHIVPTGLRPSFERRLRPLGITLPAELFEPRAPERG